MPSWLSGYSKNTIAFIALSLGLAGLIISQPPHTLCDSQIDQIRETQKHFLYPDPKSKVVKTTPYQAQRDRCKMTNDPGGCYELFQGVRKLAEDLNTFTVECSAAPASIPEVKTALWETAELMVRLAWGDKPPLTFSSKLGWLDVADVSLFCRLKARLTLVFGEESWNALREKLMVDLPGAKALTRNQVWELILFSENCSRYP